MGPKTLLAALFLAGAAGCGSSTPTTTSAKSSADARTESSKATLVEEEPKFESMLDEPHLFGLTLGDTSGYVARTLGVKTVGSRCSNESALERDTSDQWFCWDRTKIKGAAKVRAGFIDRKSSLFLYAFEVEYPHSEGRRVFDDLKREPELGKVYSEPRAGTVEWDWGHTRVSLEEAENHVLLSVRSLLETLGTKSLFSEPRKVSPWELDLGHDTQAVADEKLKRAGFSVQTSCVDLTPAGANVHVKSCGYENSGVTGLKYLKMELTSIAGGEPRVSELECVYEPMMIDVVRRELRDRYGEPLKGSPKDTPSWLTVPSSVFMLTAPDYLAVSYHHGRLHRLAQASVKSSGP
jgi:hypothetical protein